MSATWTGFSEEDQAKIKLATENKVLPVVGEGRDKLETLVELRNGTLTKKLEGSSQQKTSKNKKISKSPSVEGNFNHDLPAEALLSSPKHRQGPESPVHVKLKIVEDSASFEIMEAIPLDGEMGKNKDAADNPPMDVMTPPSPGPHSDLTNGAKKEPINLDEFDRRQKLIEEQNRLKKELLGKALALRKMKTQAEAQKLQQIQEELSQLDASLSNDVAILRGHIEIASAELSEAERRYAKAEREFVEAKQLLFGKRERKDLLTEHLCTIIQENEMRKARRLTDLMVQLADEDQATEAALNQIGLPVKTTDEV